MSRAMTLKRVACFGRVLGTVCVFFAPQATVLADLPGTAEGSGWVTYTVTSSGWQKGTLEVVEEEGNYTASGWAYPLVTCTVQYGTNPRSRSGTITYRQNFVWTGGGTAGVLSYTQNVKASARIERPGQTANGTSYSYFLFGGIEIGNSVEASAPSSGPDPQEDFQEHSSTITMVGIIEGTWSETAVVTAAATTP